MHSSHTLAALCLVLLAGCTPQQTPPPAASQNAPPTPATLAPVLPLKQVMTWVIDPAADVIWDSVKSVSTEAGTKEIAPKNDEQWDAVRDAAATLMESANLLMLPGRAREQQSWANFAKGLSKTAAGAMKAAESRDKDALFAAGGAIYTVCKACHENFAKHLVSGADAHPPVALR